MKKPKLYQPARQRMTVFSWIIILLLLTMYIFPLFYMVSTSLKTMYEVNLSPPRLLPSDPQWQNFAEAWRKMNFLHYLKNSVIASVLTILGQLLVCVPCAYAFAKKQFRFKKFLNGLVLFGAGADHLPVHLPHREQAGLDRHLSGAGGAVHLLGIFHLLPDAGVQDPAG